MEALVLKIVSGLLIGAIGAIIKLFISHAVVKSKHDGLQLEVNEHKQSVKEDMNVLRKDHKDEVAEIRNLIETRFTKVENLLEKLYTYERDHGRRRDD